MIWLEQNSWGCGCTSRPGLSVESDDSYLLSCITFSNDKPRPCPTSRQRWKLFMQLCITIGLRQMRRLDQTLLLEPRIPWIKPRMHRSKFVSAQLGFVRHYEYSTVIAWARGHEYIKYSLKMNTVIEDNISNSQKALLYRLSLLSMSYCKYWHTYTRLSTPRLLVSFVFFFSRFRRKRYPHPWTPSVWNPSFQAFRTSGNGIRKSIYHTSPTLISQVVGLLGCVLVDRRCFFDWVASLTDGSARCTQPWTLAGADWCTLCSPWLYSVWDWLSVLQWCKIQIQG